jgi:hypothetical protein
MHRKLVSLAAIAVAVAAISGIGYAAIPGSNGVISACKDTKGSLKVIDVEAGQACGPNQQPLSWNQQGPRGDAGSPLAYAVVGSGGNVFEDRSKAVGDGDVTKPAGTFGIYCFNVDFPWKHAIATLAWAGPGTGPLYPPIVVDYHMGSPCPNETEVAVLAVDPDTGAPLRDVAFWISFTA